MNPKQLQRLILLEQSGELSARQRRRLDEWKQQDAHAGKMQQELRWLQSVLPEPVPPVTHAARDGIHQRLSADVSTVHVLHPWRFGAVAAALLLLLVPFWFFSRGPDGGPVPETAGIELPADGSATDWEDPLATEFEDIEKLMASISLDGFLDDIDL